MAMPNRPPPRSSRGSNSSRIPKAGTTARRFATRADADGRARVDRDLFPAGARRALALAPHRCGGDLALLCRRALTLQIADDAAQRSVRLGPDLAAGEVPQAIVPPHAWQAAESTGDWTLVGCTVAPGFDFAKFELAPKDWEPT